VYGGWPRGLFWGVGSEGGSFGGSADGIELDRSGGGTMTGSGRV
jgi:hypothetical protein